MEQPRINYLNNFLLVNQEPSIGKLRVLSLQSFAGLYGSSPVVERTSYDTIHTLCILSQYGRIAVGTQIARIPAYIVQLMAGLAIRGKPASRLPKDGDEWRATEPAKWKSE